MHDTEIRISIMINLINNKRGKNMAGGFWGKGENPFWNHDSDAALNDKQKLDAEADAFRARLDSEDSHHRAVQAQQRATSVIRQRDELVLKLQNHKEAFYKLALRSNFLKNTIDSLIEKHPEMESEIMSLIEEKKKVLREKQYQDKWWEWVKNTDLDIKHEYLDFPYKKEDE